MTLAAGFIPWTIFFFFSLFGLKLSKPEQPIKEILKIRGNVSAPWKKFVYLVWLL